MMFVIRSEKKNNVDLKIQSETNKYEWNVKKLVLLSHTT